MSGLFAAGLILGDPVPGQQAAGLAADRLSGMFLALAFGAAVPVSVAFASWGRGIRGPARAIMAGVCVNVAFYGIWRTLALLGRAPGWLVGVLLVLGALTALLGIAHAAVQNRLSRVIAYSSVENTGLIVTGFGIALTGAAVGDRRLVAVGLLAGTLQIVAHTVAKSLLFTSAAVIEAAAGSDDLEELRGPGPRGRARRTPWSGFGLAVGSLTLAGLPPTVGFVSEWFLLEALMQQFRVPGLGYRLVLALAGAAVALTFGFAGVTFVRLVGLIVLGRGRESRRSVPPAGADYGWAGRGGGGGARGVLLRDRGGDPAGDPGDRRRAVARGPGLADHGRAEVPNEPGGPPRAGCSPGPLASGAASPEPGHGGAARVARRAAGWPPPHAPGTGASLADALRGMVIST